MERFGLQTLFFVPRYARVTDNGADRQVRSPILAVGDTVTNAPRAR
jgi:hypothetical protein